LSSYCFESWVLYSAAEMPTTLSKSLSRETLRKVLRAGAAAILIWIYKRLHPRRRLPFSCSWIEVLRSYYKGKDLELHHEVASQTFPKCWTVKMPHDPRIFGTVDPKVVEHILHTKFSIYDKGPQWRTAFHDLLGDGIFNADGVGWTKQRKVAVRVFSQKNLRGFMSEAFIQSSKRLVAIIQKAADQSRSIDVQDLFARYTLESTGHIGFGVDIGCLDEGHDAQTFGAAFNTSSELITNRFIDPVWKLKRLLNIGMEKRLRDSIQGVHSFCNNIIAQRRKADAADLEGRSDILSQFMRYTDDANGSAKQYMFNDAELKDVVINFILAGRDTTANLLTWSMFEIARNPQVLVRLRTEFMNVSEKEREGVMGFDLLKSMPYMKAFLMEVLRLHPSVPLDFKQASQDDVLPDGTVIHRGERVMFVTWSMGRQPELWKDPELFDPCRFMDDSAENFQEPSRYLFPVFHAGPRLCLGKDMAWLSAGLVLKAILEKFDLQMVLPVDEVVYGKSLTLPVNGELPFHFVPLTDSTKPEA